MGKTATPVIINGGAEFHDSLKVEIKSPWSNPAHHYTTDGSEPTEASSVYKDPIEITATTTLRYPSA